jgi:ABC-2 type transport system permease protein
VSDRAASLPAPDGVLHRRQSAISDALTMGGRCVRLSLRNIDALLTALILPVILMLVFVYLFGGAIKTGTAYVNYVVPGVILLCAAFGSAATAVSVSQDMTSAIIDRLRSMDVGGAAFLAGHVWASLMRNAASAVLVFGVAVAIGFRPDARPLDWLAAVAILAAFVLAVSWLAAAIGLLATSPEAANGFTFFIMFLPYASSAFVPVDTMPSWLQGFAGHQPITPVIESLRGLLVGTPVGTSAWTAVAWCGAILVVSVAVSGVLFRRRTS